MFIVQWAGVYALQKDWVTQRAGEGWLVLNINAHDIPIDESVKLGVTAASLILRHRGTVFPELTLEKLYDELVT